VVLALVTTSLIPPRKIALLLAVALNPVPVIVTEAPAEAMAGEKEVIVGTCPKTRFAEKRNDSKKDENRNDLTIDIKQDLTLKSLV
jgi:hypothetical protein